MGEHTRRQPPSASQQELEPEPDHAGTLISDFQPPELLENKLLLF